MARLNSWLSAGRHARAGLGADPFAVAMPGYGGAGGGADGFFPPPVRPIPCRHGRAGLDAGGAGRDILHLDETCRAGPGFASRSSWHFRLRCGLPAFAMLIARSAAACCTPIDRRHQALADVLDAIALLAPDFLPPNILPWLVGAWLCGVALFSLRLAGGFLLLEHKRRRQSSVPGPRILAMCQELQHQLGLNRAIRYLECSWLQAPAVIGWIRPIDSAAGLGVDRPVRRRSCAR